MLDFYQTSGGRRFMDSTMPEIARQLERIADELKRANDLRERNGLDDQIDQQCPAGFIGETGVGHGDQGKGVAK